MKKCVCVYVNLCSPKYVHILSLGRAHREVRMRFQFRMLKRSLLQKQSQKKQSSLNCHWCVGFAVAEKHFCKFQRQFYCLSNKNLNMIDKRNENLSIIIYRNIIIWYYTLYRKYHQYNNKKRSCQFIDSGCHLNIVWMDSDRLQCSWDDVNRLQEKEDWSTQITFGNI